jgi:DNA (cytosine-5)-methyltransferase 1
MSKFVSLFSGAGGLDLGLELAGWDCLFATDHEQAAVDTLEANRGYRLGQGRKAFEHTEIELADVRNLTGRHILGLTGQRKGEIPLLAGGPPCQSWSSGGHQKGYDDPRGRLVDDYLRIAEQLDTRWLLFENVRGLLTARGIDGVPGSALARLRKELFARGWQSSVELVNAADHGIAQRRVRLILIGYRAGDAPEFPTATHAALASAKLRPWISLGQCLAKIDAPSGDEIQRPSGKMAVDLDGLPPGTGAKSPGKREATRPGGHWGYKQGAFIADLQLPARTVTASSQQDWIYDPALGLRRLCPRECAAIQSFPSDWKFVGNRSIQYRLVGNAVPPMLGMALGAKLSERLSRDAPHDRLGASELLPLPAKLQSAIAYTVREENRNGASRRAVGKRAVTVAVV